MSADALVYLDSSALVKLALPEAESAALRAFLASRRIRSSSALVRVEVPRAARAHGVVPMSVARTVVSKLALVPLTDALLDAAAALDAPLLRSLDAIHVASALKLGDAVDTLVTYDRRMAAAAEAHGLRVASPGT